MNAEDREFWAAWILRRAQRRFARGWPGEAFVWHDLLLRAQVMYED